MKRLAVLATLAVSLTVAVAGPDLRIRPPDVRPTITYPFSVAGIFDVNAPKSESRVSAVIAYSTSLATQGNWSVDAIAFGGSTVGSNTAITGGTATALGYSFNLLGLVQAKAQLGVGLADTAGSKPHAVLYGGIAGTFRF